jgi:hypothetical protein
VYNFKRSERKFIGVCTQKISYLCTKKLQGLSLSLACYHLPLCLPHPLTTLYPHKMELHDDDEPTCMYTSRGDKIRILPCVECGGSVNGVRQCTICFGHLHRSCGKSQQRGFRSSGAVCTSCSGDISQNQSQILTQAMYVESPSPPGTPSSVQMNNHPEQSPSQVYTSSDRSLRKRRFPCPVCGDTADGSHQCGLCFKHIHVFCAATPFPGSEEGFGQLQVCPSCHGTQTADTSVVPTQTHTPPPPPPPPPILEEAMCTETDSTSLLPITKRTTTGRRSKLSKGAGGPGGWSICNEHDVYE